jgi:hypothetical protein
MLPNRLLAASLVALVPVAVFGANPVMRFTFDPDYSGVSGNIEFSYYGDDRGGAAVSANLGFKRFDMKALKALDGNCTADKITDFTWHIHTMWKPPQDSTSSSMSFAKCGKAVTGNHYDPYKICGPASEYVDTPACAPKVKDYKCTPDEYKKNFAACESGDLSGKIGNFQPDAEALVNVHTSDPRFPFSSEATKEWSIVIHAVCGKASPRVACAVGHMLDSKSITLKKTKKHGKKEADFTIGNKVHVRVHEN